MCDVGEATLVMSNHSSDKCRCGDRLCQVRSQRVPVLLRASESHFFDRLVTVAPEDVVPGRVGWRRVGSGFGRVRH